MSWVWNIPHWTGNQAEADHAESAPRPAEPQVAGTRQVVPAPPVMRLREGASAKDASTAHEEQQARTQGANGALPTTVHETLRAPGQPLDAPTRTQMESRFGHSFDHVRIHDDERAAASANAVDALAYTVGSHIVFGRGEYAPRTPRGRSVLAHELTHVLQQGSRLFHPADAGRLTLHDAHGSETEADAAAHVAGGGGRILRVSSLSGLALQRQKKSSPPSLSAVPTVLPTVVPNAGANRNPLSIVAPKITMERKFPGINLPPIETPSGTAKASLALVVSTTFTPTSSHLEAFTFTDKELSIELGNFAMSFTLAKLGKGAHGVAFTSKFPGVGRLNSQTLTIEPPFTFIWASILNPPLLFLKRFRVSGEFRIQLEVTFTPRWTILTPEEELRNEWSRKPIPLVPVMKPVLVEEIFGIIARALAL
jgi:hypothetical protein